MPDKGKLPYMLGRQSLGPQWDAIKEEVMGPEEPVKIDTNDSDPAKFMGDFTVDVVDRVKYPGAGPHVTRVHDPKG